MNIRRLDIYEQKIIKLENEKKEFLEFEKEIEIENEKLKEELFAKEKQIEDIGQELEEVQHLRSLVEEQEFELENRSKELKTLNRRITDLKRDLFYKNKNVFEHNYLQRELEHERKEKEMLKERIIELENDFNHLRIETSYNGPQVDSNDQLIKQVSKLENQINTLKRENTSMKKDINLDTQSLKGSVLSRFDESSKNLYSDSKTRFSKKNDQIEKLQLQNKILTENNKNLIQEIKSLQNKQIKQVKENQEEDKDNFLQKKLLNYQNQNISLKDKIQELEIENQKLKDESFKKSLTHGNTQSSGNKMAGDDNVNALQIEISNLKFSLEEKEKEIELLNLRLEEKDEEKNDLEEDYKQKLNESLQKNVKLGNLIIMMKDKMKTEEYSQITESSVFQEVSKHLSNPQSNKNQSNLHYPSYPKEKLDIILQNQL